MALLSLSGCVGAFDSTAQLFTITYEYELVKAGLMAYSPLSVYCVLFSISKQFTRYGKAPEGCGEISASCWKYLPFTETSVAPTNADGLQAPSAVIDTSRLGTPNGVFFQQRRLGSTFFFEHQDDGKGGCERGAPPNDCPERPTACDHATATVTSVKACTERNIKMPIFSAAIDTAKMIPYGANQDIFATRRSDAVFAGGARVRVSSMTE
jgi:hypothetical protein